MSMLQCWPACGRMTTYCCWLLFCCFCNDHSHTQIRNNTMTACLVLVVMSYYDYLFTLHTAGQWLLQCLSAGTSIYFISSLKSSNRTYCSTWMSLQFPHRLSVFLQSSFLLWSFWPRNHKNTMSHLRLLLQMQTLTDLTVIFVIERTLFIQINGGPGPYVKMLQGITELPI